MNHRTTSLLLALALAACAPPAEDTPDDTGDSPGDDTSQPGDTGDTAAPDDTSTPGETDEPQDTQDTQPQVCDAAVTVIPAVVASSADLDACCGGSFAALTDDSGLSTPNQVTLHDCADATTFKSSPGQLAGTLTFDLGGVFRVDDVTLWNSGQVSGERGVHEAVLTGSLDGVTFTPIAGGDLVLGPPRCPALPELFVLHGSPARYLRLEVLSTWSKGGTTNFGLGAIRFGGVPDCGLAEITDIVATSTDLGACCGGSFGALTDGSGLDTNDAFGEHTCSDDEGWKSNASATKGDLILDLGDVERVAELAVWNSGQAGGDRGVRKVEVSTSTDGVTHTPVPSAAALLDAEEACPTGPQFLQVRPAVEARYLKLGIDGNQGAGATNVGLGEIKVYAEAP